MCPKSSTVSNTHAERSFSTDTDRSSHPIMRASPTGGTRGSSALPRNIGTFMDPTASQTEGFDPNFRHIPSACDPMQQYEVSQRQRRGLHRPHRKVDSTTLTGEEATAARCRLSCSSRCAAAHAKRQTHPGRSSSAAQSTTRASPRRSAIQRRHPPRHTCQCGFQKANRFGVSSSSLAATYGAMQ